MKKYLLRNILWCVVIFILCTLPGEKVPDPKLNIPHLDKIVHFALFFILSIFVCAELKFQTKLSYIKIVLTSSLLVTIYGAVIELLQHYVFVYRSGDIVDLLADLIGGIVGAIIFPWLKEKKDKLVNKEPYNRFKILKKIL